MWNIVKYHIHRALSTWDHFLGILIIVTTLRTCFIYVVTRNSMPMTIYFYPNVYTYHHRIVPLHWRHNGHDSVSNHQPHDCLLNRLFRRRSKKILKLRVTGLCAGNSQETGEFPTQMASNAENVSIWWRHHALWLVNFIIVPCLNVCGLISWIQPEKGTPSNTLSFCSSPRMCSISI